MKAIVESLPGGRHRREGVILALATLGILLVSANVKNHYAGYDSRGALLVSESFLRHGTLRLDAYGDELAGFGYRIEERGGHSYYAFPLGTSLLTIPVVALANALGLEMIEGGADARVQIALAAVTVAMAFLLIFVLARGYLGFGFSLAFASVFVLGSSFVSTMGTALWSFNSTVIFTLACLIVLQRERLYRGWILPSGLGLLLFCAFLCRPTAAIFIVLVLAYLLCRDRRAFVLTAAAAGAGLLVLMWFSWREFGQVLPDYYLPRRIAETRNFWMALRGNLLSPARGVLIYSPFLIVVAMAAVRVRREVVRCGLFWLGLAWFSIHLVSISRFPHWWAGHCFGSRLLTDAMPALALVCLVVLRAATTRIPLASRRTWAICLAGTAAIAIFINTVQGLYNPNTRSWNDRPDVDDYPYTLFDWRYPQFLATAARNEQKVMRHCARFGFPAIGTATDAKGLEYGTGWRLREDWGRWAVAREVTFTAPVPEQRTVLVVRAAPWPGQTASQMVRVLTGDQMLGEFEVSGPAWEWRDFRVSLPHDLRPGTTGFRLEMDRIWADAERPDRPRSLPVQAIRFELDASQRSEPTD